MLFLGLPICNPFVFVYIYWKYAFFPTFSLNSHLFFWKVFPFAFFASIHAPLSLNRSFLYLCTSYIYTRDFHKYLKDEINESEPMKIKGRREEERIGGKTKFVIRWNIGESMQHRFQYSITQQFVFFTNRAFLQCFFVHHFYSVLFTQVQVKRKW